MKRSNNFKAFLFFIVNTKFSSLMNMQYYVSVFIQVSHIPSRLGLSDR